MHAGFVSYQLRKELTQVVVQAQRSNGGDEDGALNSAIAKLSRDGRLTGKSLQKAASTLGIQVPPEVGKVVLAEMCDRSITHKGGKGANGGKVSGPKESKTGEDDEDDSGPNPDEFYLTPDSLKEFLERKSFSKKTIEGALRDLAMRKGLDETFKEIDTDGSGELDEEEFASVLKALRISPEMVSCFVELMDADG